MRRKRYDPEDAAFNPPDQTNNTSENPKVPRNIMYGNPTDLTTIAERNVALITQPKKRLEAWMYLNPTSFEIKVWNFIGATANPWFFHRQIALGGYILDFFSETNGLCLEADGPDHLKQLESDKKRDDVLYELGVRTIRLTPKDFVTRSKVEIFDLIDSYVKMSPLPKKYMVIE
jgi:very-short-patch-repair endonuclease